MNRNKKIVAIIPARGGSKGIPKKNIVDFCGRPLLAWSILQSKASRYVDDVYVSTDDADIAAVARAYGANVIDRPKEISGDTATSESALMHAVERIEKEGTSIRLIVFLQATSPLREPKDIDNAVHTLLQEKADSLFSAAEIGDLYIWKKEKGGFKSFNYDYKNRKRRQDYGEQYAENGSIYVFTPDVLRAHNNRLGKKITISYMDLWKTFEIDTGHGLEFCQSLFQLKGLDKHIQPKDA